MDKPSLVIALGRKPKSVDDGEKNSDHEDMLKSAMQDFIAAVHDKDADVALSAYQDLCELSEEDEDSEEGDDEDSDSY